MGASYVFRGVIRTVVRKPVPVLILAVLLSVAGIGFASRLAIDTDLANLIPEDYESVKALERLRETVGSEEEAAVAIVSPSFEANRAFAEALIPEVLNLQGEGYAEPYFGRIEYRRDVTFLENNALYFATDQELDELEEWLEGKIEDARLEANPFFFDLEEEDEEPDSVAESLRDTYDGIVSKEYPISDDSTTLVLRLFSTGSQTDIQFIEDAYADLQALVDRMDPASWEPDMHITLAGRMQRRLVEVNTIRGDVFGSFGSGVSAVLLLVILYFAYKAYVARVGHRIVGRVLLAELARLPVMAVVIGAPLLMSLSWTFGLAEIIYDDLNLMTSTLGLVLFGLGIDFGIHFYARYAEERAAGRPVEDAAEITFLSTGQAIAVGAFTTAMALYVLVFADFRGFSQFGFISGTGILFALAAMLLVLPALLSILERIGILDLEARDGRTVQAAPSTRSFPAVRFILVVSVLVSVAAVVASTRVGFEYQFGQLEPVYAEYNARRDIVNRVSTPGRGGRNPAYIVVDDAEEVGAVTAALREKMAADTLSPTIDRVESLQDRFPIGPEDQERRLGRIATIRTLLDDPLLSSDESEDLDRLRRAASTTAPIAMDAVPEFLARKFTDKNGELGRFVMIYPSIGLSDGRNSIAFSEDVGTVVTADGRTVHAGSSSIVAADMLRLMRDETPWMVAATFVIVMLLMLANFASLRWALLAIVPLLVGVLWMLFLVEVFGLKLNFYNMIVMPAVLGIGNDAGVHIVHRYRELGPGSIRAVLRSTGEHVTMGSLTTMLGFAGLLLSFHPGLESIGYLAIVGIGSTLAAALLFLPALLQVLEPRD